MKQYNIHATKNCPAHTRPARNNPYENSTGAETSDNQQTNLTSHRTSPKTLTACTFSKILFAEQECFHNTILGDLHQSWGYEARNWHEVNSKREMHTHSRMAPSFYSQTQPPSISSFAPRGTSRNLWAILQVKFVKMKLSAVEEDSGT